MDWLMKMLYSLPKDMASVSLRPGEPYRKKRASNNNNSLNKEILLGLKKEHNIS